MLIARRLYLAGDGPRPVRAGSAWPLSSGRSVRRGSRVKRDFACTFTRHFSPVLVCPAVTVMLEAGGADTYTQRARPGSEPSQNSRIFRLHSGRSGRRGARWLQECALRSWATVSRWPAVERSGSDGAWKYISTWSPHGLHMASTRFPHGLHMVSMRLVFTGSDQIFTGGDAVCVSKDRSLDYIIITCPLT
jgi:hypothetical protein